MAITITSPVSRQVVQRQGNNTALLTITGSVTGVVTQVQAMATVMAGGSGISTPWVAIDSSIIGGQYFGGLTLDAGGWYSISVRSMNGSTVVDTATVSKVGVGEVFILCGQSNSANFEQTITTPTDDRVSAANYVTGIWQFAVDPQPDPLGNGGTSGSVWPTAFSEVASVLNLPVGLLMTGVGGTSIAQWLPGGTLFPNLEAALAYVGVNGARSILWCQGEQDTLLGTTEAVYQSDLSTIIAATRSYAQWDVPWMVSQTSYTLGQTSSAVIAAQQAVVNGIDILSGPYTDQYGSAYRYDNIHFNLTGQLAVGGDWACDILLESIYPIQWIDPQHGSISNVMSVNSSQYKNR